MVAEEKLYSCSRKRTRRQTVRDTYKKSGKNADGGVQGKQIRFYFGEGGSASGAICMESVAIQREKTEKALGVCELYTKGRSEKRKVTGY